MDRARTPPNISVWMFCRRVQFSRPWFTEWVWGGKEIESRHKLSLSGDDSVNLESFTRELPKVFGDILTLNMPTIRGGLVGLLFLYYLLTRAGRTQGLKRDSGTSSSEKWLTSKLKSRPTSRVDLDLTRLRCW